MTSRPEQKSNSNDNGHVCSESTIESATTRDGIQRPALKKGEDTLYCESTIESANRRGFIKKAALVGVAAASTGLLLGKNVAPESSATSCVNGTFCNLRSCDVGIGTCPTFAYGLHLAAGKELRIEGGKSSSDTADYFSFGGYGTFGIDAPGIPNGRFVVENSGNIGLGTSSPNARVSLGTFLGDAVFLYDGPSDKYGFSIASGELRIYNGAEFCIAHTSFGKYNGSTFTEYMRLTNQGRLGIGNKFPCSSLCVESHCVTTPAVQGGSLFFCSSLCRCLPGCGIGVSGYSGSQPGVYGNSNRGPGVQGISRIKSGVVGSSSCGVGVQGISSASDGVFGCSASSTGVYGKGKTFGVFGVPSASCGTGVIGCASKCLTTSCPPPVVGKIGVRGRAQGGGMGVWGCSNSSVGFGVVGTSKKHTGVAGRSSGGFVNCTAGPGIGVCGSGYYGVQGSGGGIGVVATSCCLPLFAGAFRPKSVIAQFKNARNQTPCTTGCRTAMIQLETGDSTPVDWNLGVAGACNPCKITDSVFFIGQPKKGAKLVVNPNGNVGIGTPNPTTLLDVNGTIFGSKIGAGITSPRTTFQVNGSVAAKIVSKSTNYAMTATDFAVLADAHLGGFAVTLPPAATAPGMIVYVKKTDGSSNVVMVSADSTASDNIEGVATKNLTKQYDVMQLISNGVHEWFVLSGSRCGVFVT